MRFKGAQIVKRILLEKNSIKKVLKINEFHTSNYATNHLHSVFNTKKTFHSEYKRCSFDDLSIFEIYALGKFNIIIQDNVEIYTLSRVEQNKIVYNCESYEKTHKRCSSYVKWEFNQKNYYGKILRFLKINDKKVFIALQFKLLDIFESFDISLKYKKIFKDYKLNDYFISASTNESSFMCYPVTSLFAICIKIEKKNFHVLTEVFNFEHD